MFIERDVACHFRMGCQPDFPAVAFPGDGTGLLDQLPAKSNSPVSRNDGDILKQRTLVNDRDNQNAGDGFIPVNNPDAAIRDRFSQTLQHRRQIGD